MAEVPDGVQRLGEYGLLGSLFVASLTLWWFERRLLATCSDKLVEAWKSLGELVAAHNQVTREQILSQDARSRALEAQTRAYELSLQVDVQRTEAARAMAQEIKELRGKIEALEDRVRTRP